MVLIFVSLKTQKHEFNFFKLKNSRNMNLIFPVLEKLKKHKYKCLQATKAQKYGSTFARR
eukprot:UN10072